MKKLGVTLVAANSPDHFLADCPIDWASPGRGRQIEKLSLVAKLKGARVGSDALNGKYDEPKSIPKRDYASAPGQRRRSLREVATEIEGPEVSKPEFHAVLGFARRQR